MENLQLDIEQNIPDWDMSLKDWIAVLAASLGAFMAILDIQITNASMREIQGSLGLDLSEGGWISTAYLIAEIIVIPLTGFLAKVFGMRRYMVTNCILFVLASLLCGLAWDLPSIIFFRVLQGLSGGILIPMAFQTILLFMPPEKKTVGLTIFGLTATLAPTLGPSLGGFLTDTYGWRTIFFINVVPGTLMVFALIYGMPNAPLKLNQLKKMDIWGTLTLTLGLGTLTYILEEGARVEWFSDFNIQICFLITLVTLPVFFALQILRKNPLLNLKLLANRNFSISGLITMLSAMALYGGIYALSLYLSEIQSFRPRDIGAVLMWIGIPQLFVMPTLPYLMKKIDLRILSVFGLALFAYSNFLNTAMSIDYGGNEFRTSLIIRAIGQPLFMIPLSTIGMSMVTPAEVGNASAIYNILRNLGGSIGIALTGTFLVSRQNMHFYHYAEKLSTDDTSLRENLTGLQNLLMSRGVASADAKSAGLKLVIDLAHRDALIQSFSDVYLIMAGGLFACIILIALFRRVKISHNKVVID